MKYFNYTESLKRIPLVIMCEKALRAYIKQPLSLMALQYDHCSSNVLERSAGYRLKVEILHRFNLTGTHRENAKVLFSAGENEHLLNMILDSLSALVRPHKWGF